MRTLLYILGALALAYTATPSLGAPADGLDVFRRAGVRAADLNPNVVRQYQELTGLARTVEWPSNRTYKLQQYQNYRATGGARSLEEYDLSARQTIQNGEAASLPGPDGSARQGYLWREQQLFTEVEPATGRIQGHYRVDELPSSTATVARPSGVPNEWIEQPARSVGHTKWVNPDNSHDYVRLRADGTVTQVRDGAALDINGNRVALDSPEAHGTRPDEFIFRERQR